VYNRRTQGRATIRVPKSELDGLGACHSMYRRIIPQISENAESAKCYILFFIIPIIIISPRNQ